MENWYLLFGGSSVDGRGEGKYQGRTLSKKEAIDHFQQCNSDPYSIGYVLIVKSDICRRAIYLEDFE